MRYQSWAVSARHGAHLLCHDCLAHFLRDVPCAGALLQGSEPQGSLKAHFPPPAVSSSSSTGISYRKSAYPLPAGHVLLRCPFSLSLLSIYIVSDFDVG